MLARVVFFVVAPVALASTLHTSERVTPTHSDGLRAGGATPTASINLFSSPADDPLRDDDADADAGLDVYGNEVTAAVATYKVDAAGTLYELHSPNTEVPRLPAPKS
jgi:hypothetical protein